MPSKRVRQWDGWDGAEAVRLGSATRPGRRDAWDSDSPDSDSPDSPSDLARTLASIGSGKPQLLSLREEQRWEQWVQSARKAGSQIAREWSAAEQEGVVWWPEKCCLKCGPCGKQLWDPATHRFSAKHRSRCPGGLPPLPGPAPETRRAIFCCRFLWAMPEPAEADYRPDDAEEADEPDGLSRTVTFTFAGQGWHIDLPLPVEPCDGWCVTARDIFTQITDAFKAGEAGPSATGTNLEMLGTHLEMPTSVTVDGNCHPPDTALGDFEHVKIRFEIPR